MRRAVLAAALAALLTPPALAQPQATAPAAQQPVQGAANAENGRRIVQNGTDAGAPPCSQCHGANGLGNAEQGIPRLDGQSGYYLFKQLEDYASGARGNDVMTAVAQALTDAERQDTAAFYAALRVDPPPAPGIDAATARKGRMIVEAGIAGRGVQGCANCHGPDGMGLAPAAPRLAGQFAGYARAQFQAFHDGTRKNDTAAVMRDLSHRLPQPEMEAVTAYLEALRPAAQD
ncbi:c-type cytochrome [Paracraurococcus lichenis]|uniref:C-type cytochrome n=1 Tax=Paracraurococcus lichenis TaxID=3064888 RepID=A0ABT9DYT5_9PROT|nr:c-type cytochrome [Paracraurococcus sp. LOR1-02]MDO9709070.1 c-type cytochrome [Paracraurococcus sp. LOR1-02]